MSPRLETHGPAERAFSPDELEAIRAAHAAGGLPAVQALMPNVPIEELRPFIYNRKMRRAPGSVRAKPTTGTGPMSERELATPYQQGLHSTDYAETCRDASIYLDGLARWLAKQPGGAVWSEAARANSQMMRGLADALQVIAKARDKLTEVTTT